MNLVRLQLVHMYEVEALEMQTGRIFSQKLTDRGLCRWFLLQQQKGEKTPIKIISFSEIKPEFQEVLHFD